jgi:hypothetical protein
MIARARERDAVARRDDGLHAQVGARRETPVEPDLLLAHLQPALGGAVVEERQPDGLLELVGAVAREEHP